MGKRAVTFWVYIEFIAARLPTLQILGERKPIALNINSHFGEEEYAKSTRSNLKGEHVGSPLQPYRPVGANLRVRPLAFLY